MADEMPTNTLHRCTACGCLWRQWIGLDGSWSLADANQRSCRSCDNSPEFLSLLDPPPTALKAENEKLRDILRKLSNAVLGKLRFMEPQVREDFGEENYDLLMGRAVEARAALTQERA